MKSGNLKVSMTQPRMSVFVAVPWFSLGAPYKTPMLNSHISCHFSKDPSQFCSSVFLDFCRHLIHTKSETISCPEQEFSTLVNNCRLINVFKIGLEFTTFSLFYEYIRHVPTKAFDGLTDSLPLSWSHRFSLVVGLMRVFTQISLHC